MAYRSTFRIRWVDTDVAGVMHYSNYFRYFEACEQDFYHSHGKTLDQLRKKYGILLPRVEAHCKYRTACRYDDLVEVELTVREVAEKTITYDFRMVRKQDGKVAAEGYLKCIAVNSDWKAVPIPVEVANVIRESGV